MYFPFTFIRKTNQMQLHTHTQTYIKVSMSFVTKTFVYVNRSHLIFMLSFIELTLLICTTFESFIYKILDWSYKSIRKRKVSDTDDKSS